MAGPGSLAWNMPPRPDDLGRKQKDLIRSQREQAAGNILQGAQVGAGGILINNGGSLTIQGTGTFNTNGTITTSSAFSAGTTVTAGGNISSTGGNVSAAGSVSGASGSFSGGVSGGSFSGTTCALTGDLSGANVRLGGSGTVYSMYALSNPVVTAYVAAYINGPDGRFGATPSARRFKQNIRRKEYSVEDAQRLSKLIVNYRLKEAVKAYGDDAPVEVGVIAEELIKAGFPEFVIHDAKGRTLSVAYERIWLVIASAFGQLAADVDAIKAHLGI